MQARTGGHYTAIFNWRDDESSLAFAAFIVLTLRHSIGRPQVAWAFFAAVFLPILVSPNIGRLLDESR